MIWMQKGKWSLFFRTVIWTVLIAFTAETFGFTSAAYAQTYMQSLPVPGTMVTLSSSYAPILMKGIKTYPDNPFRFDFFIDPGQGSSDNKSVGQESNKLIKYFLASLTVPEEQLWVNLSPYEKDRIMPAGFGVTEMGRDLLAQDYLLKQISASLLDPTSPSGEKFWKKIYDKIRELGGEAGVVDTFNKVWIIPESAEVYTKDNSAFVVESHLKVMLEEDYLSMQQNAASSAMPIKRNQYSQIVREIIVPALEKEVNDGENFAMLRQVYHSMILATWFKRHLRESVFSKIYVGQNKVGGVDVTDHDIKEKIYQQYLAAFQKGVFNFIREDVDPVTEESTPRKYFAGGVDLTNFGKVSSSAVYRESSDPLSLRKVNLRPAQFMGGAYYKVSSVVINQAGVSWYNRFQTGVPDAVSSTAIVSAADKPQEPNAFWATFKEKIIPQNRILRRAAGIALSTVFLLGGLGLSSQAEAAQFDFQDQRGVIVQIQPGDTLGNIVQTLQTQKKVKSDVWKGKLWGANGSVERIAEVMGITNSNDLIPGDTYVIPVGFLDGIKNVPALQQVQQVQTLTQPPVVQPVVTPLARKILPPIAASQGDRLPLGVSLTEPAPDLESQAIAQPIVPSISARPNPLLPFTVGGLLLSGLVWAGRKQIMQKTAQVIVFPGRNRTPAEPQTPARPAAPQAPAVEAKVEPVLLPTTTSLKDVLAQQIRSLSLDYLQADRRISESAKKVVAVLVSEFRRKLQETQLWNTEKVDGAAKTFETRMLAGLIEGGEQILDRGSLDRLIEDKAAELAAKWSASGNQDLYTDPELYAFIDQQINAVVISRVKQYVDRLEEAMADDQFALYLAAMDAAITYHSTVPGATIEGIPQYTLNEIAEDFSRPMDLKIVFQKPGSVSSLQREAVNKESVRHYIVTQSQELQAVEALLDKQSRGFAASLGDYLTNGFTPLKLSTKVTQMPAAQAVSEYFVPTMTRYFLTALYQRYNAVHVENLINNFVQNFSQEHPGQALTSLEVQSAINDFINGELKNAVNQALGAAIKSVEEELFNENEMAIYTGAIDVALQIERATANGSGVLIVPTVKTATDEVAKILTEDHHLAPMPFFTRAMATVLAEQTAQAPTVDVTLEPPAPSVAPSETQTPAASYALVDAMVLSTTAAGMIATGNTDTAAVLTALASPFLFRASMTASLWLHEFSHMLTAGRSAFTKENMLGGLKGREWLAMLSPFFGKVRDGKIATKEKSKLAQWANRLTGFGTSVAIVGGVATMIWSMFKMGHHGEVFAAVPLLWGTLAVALGSLKTDVIAPIQGKAKDCEFNCGLAIEVTSENVDVVLEDFKAMGQVTDIRGQQAGGGSFQAVDSNGSVVWVGGRLVNDKRGNLPETLDAMMETQKLIAKVKGYKPIAESKDVEDQNYNVLIGHYRYGTSSAPKKGETHPHQWMPDRKVEYWSIDQNGKFVVNTRNLGIKIVHNGDFDFWKLYGQDVEQSDLAYWLERVLHVPNTTDGDSPKVAGVFDYIVTKGMWDASARFAYYEAVATSFDDVFDGKFEKVVKNQADIEKNPDTPPQYAVVSRNTALSNEQIAQFATRFSEVFKLRGAQMLAEGDTDLLDLMSARHEKERVAFIKEMAANLKGLDIVQDWDQATRYRFAETALQAFLLNDEYEAAKIFMNRAIGSFGLGIGSTLNRGGMILVADGQPLSIGFDRDHKKFLAVSEQSALKIRMRNDKHLDYRLTLRQNLGHGEIVRMVGKSMRIYSRDLKRELTDEDIEKRLVPLQNNPWISPLPVMDSDDPVGDDIRDTAKVLADIKAHWDDPDSPNRQTTLNVTRLLVQKKIEQQIRSLSESYASLQPTISQKADAIGDNLRRHLVTSLRMRLSPSVDWESELKLKNGLAQFSPMLEGALSTGVDFDLIEELVREKAQELSQALLSGAMDASDLRIQAAEFARNDLNQAIDDELEKSQEHVQSALDSWQKVVDADLLLQARRVIAREDASRMVAAGQLPFKRIEDLWKTLGITPGVKLPKRGFDVKVMGLEISQWLGEQFAHDLKRLFPDLKIGTASSNKVLKNPIEEEIDDQTIVLAISQSGQTFPTLNAAIALEELAPGRVFALTGEYDTMLGQAVGQEFKPNSEFGGHIISNLTGFRPSEAVSLTGTATQQTLSELLLRIGEDFTTLFPSEHPLGMTLKPEYVKKLKDRRENVIVEAERLTGTDRDHQPIQSAENKAINTQANKWAWHVLDEPFSMILTKVHLIAAVIGGALLFPWLASLFFPLLPVWGIALLTGAALVAQYFMFEFFQWGSAWALRKIQGRETLARTGGRTIVIGDRSYIHQTLEIFVSKLNSLSKKATAVDVHGANPDDHMIARFGHRVVRGSLMWLGIVDERLGPEFKDWKSAVTMTGQQAKGVRNFGVGAEIISVGRERNFNKNATNVDLTIQGGVSDIPSEIAMLYENRFDSLSRLIAGQVFFYRMMRKVSTLDLSPRWRRALWPWAYNMNRTQSGPRIATTRSSQPAPDYKKFFKVKPRELPLGLHETHGDDDDNIYSAKGFRKDRLGALRSKRGDSASSALEEAPGGIDLNPAALKMNVHGENTLPAASSPVIKIDPQMINTLPSDHFVPMIIEVVPIPTVEMFLGMAPVTGHAGVAAR